MYRRISLIRAHAAACLALMFLMCWMCWVFGTARADVSWSDSAVGAVDSRAPRIEVPDPVEHLLFFPGDEVYFSWLVDEFHPGVADSTNHAELFLEDIRVDQTFYVPGAAFSEWTWTVPTLPPMLGRLRVTATDAFGNQTQAWSHHFTVLTSPAGAGDETPGVSRLAPARPNPFNPQTTIHFELAEAQPVRLTVYDLHGHRVRSLRDGTLAAGPHEAVWNGKGDDARRAAGGTYLIRLEIGRGSERTVLTRKAVLLP